MKYRINVKTLQGQVLTYHVSKYEAIEADFIKFTDEKTGIVKQYHSSNCEITEVQE